MALPLQTQAKYWSVVIAIFALALWFLGDVIMPFLLAGAIAYFLDPVADRLERAGFSRTLATVTISLVALLVAGAALLLVIPTLLSQTSALVNAAPDIVNGIQAQLKDRFPSIVDDQSTLRQSLETLGLTIKERGGELVGKALSSAMGVINLIVLIVVTPVVTFYLLLDWDRMIARIDQLLPLDHRPVIRQISREIDQTLASFIRGQGSVCMILGTYYAISLMIVGLQFGLVIGFVAGLITFIPYIGALVGGALAIGLGLFQFWGEWWSLGAVAIIFFIGQFIEGNILTPKLVGQSVGLHPVWLMFALSVFGSLFGFVGMLVAVPVAAAIGVLTRFALSQYQSGLLYKGVAGVTDSEISHSAEEENERDV